jgi:hypothetical protein
MSKPEQYLKERAREALLIWRDAYASPTQAPGGTFLGGLPKLPPELAWPSVAIDGELRGLIFAGQIDVADVPKDYARNDQLPREGTLYFFYQDIWETRPGEDNSIMPCAVLFHPHSSHSYAAHPPPKKLVSPNTASGSPPRFLDKSAYLRHGSFRFDAKLIPYTSYPDYFPFDPAVDAAAFDRVQDQLETASWRSSLADFATLKRPGSLGTRPEIAAWIFSWGLIELIARGVMTPRAWESTPKGDATLMSEAQCWRTRGHEQDFFSAPPTDVREEFAAWMESMQTRTKSNYDLWPDVVWHVVQRYSETGKLTEVPPDLLLLTDSRPSLDSDRHGRVSHLILGHGLSDHAAVQPEERADHVLLLRIELADMMFGEDGGQLHFWITPQDLVQRNFSAVELTC